MTERLIAIGDVHGCLDKLDRLLAEIGPRPGRDRLIFLGDLIDRGPDSRGVIDRVLDLIRSGLAVTALKGNHEAMLLEAVHGQLGLGLWEINGGRATLSSYGLTGRPRPEDLPAEHLSFLASQPLFLREGETIFVHAGLKPGRPLDRQEERDLLWIRKEFIYSDHDWEYKIVFGHTPFREPYVSGKLTGIDTGAVYGGRLTALILPEEKFIQV